MCFSVLIILWISCYIASIFVFINDATVLAFCMYVILLHLWHVRGNYITSFANSKDKGEPAHPRSLPWVFAVDLQITSRKHAYIVLTPSNPTFLL